MHISVTVRLDAKLTAAEWNAAMETFEDNEENYLDAVQAESANCMNNIVSFTVVDVEKHYDEDNNLEAVWIEFFGTDSAEI